jgi:type IV secretory pathway protease TraF
LIVSHKTFIPSFTANVSPINTSLVAQRQSQGLTTSIVDIEDVYDEFGFGVHGPQAIKNFLEHAATHWAIPPQYVIFAGDASLDPRNYMNAGDFDLVPTKLIDTSFEETASDDWLADFDNDGIADIPIGRLPVRTAAEADLVISKIVNFAPVAPQSAMLVADDPTGYYFNFEQANDQVQALLPGSMTVQRVNVRVDGIAAARTNIIDGFNQGRALVNYTGHGNVNVWTGASIFKSEDATALTNGNKLSFVVVMDCLNGLFQDPLLLSLSEALLEAPQGGAVAAFASSGRTFPDGQHEMSQQLYTSIYGSGAQPIALGDAIKIAKGQTNDIDVRRTWIYFGDPSIKIR